MASVTTAFTAIGNSAVFSVPDHSKFSLTVTGTFVGTWKLQRSDTAGAAWATLATGTTTQALTSYLSKSKSTNDPAWYRVACTAYTSGTLTAVLADVADVIQFVGAYGVTLTAPAATSLTLPTAGTLATAPATTMGDDAYTTSRETNIAGLSSAITLCTELLTDYAAHIADQGEGTEEHIALHTAGALASAVAPATLAEVITRTNDLQAKYALHNTDAASTTPTYHVADVGSGNALADATAITTLAGALAKLNDIKAKFNAHDADTTGHRTGSKYQIAAADVAYGAAILVPAVGAATGDLVVWSILNDGTGNVTGVSAVAGTNTITFTFSGDPQNDAIISYLCIPVGR